MEQIPAHYMDEFIDTCHLAARYELIRCSSGNLSRRLPDNRFMITGSRTWLEDVGPEGIALCESGTGQPCNQVTPSVETAFHAGILQNRPDAGWVLHFQSPWATTVACTPPPDPNFFVIPEIPFYIGPVTRVPFLQPGSQELAEAVTAALKESEMCLLTNHGLVTLGKTAKKTLQKAVFFELACRIILSGSGRTAALPPEALSTLLGG